ncbi:hypothetical protein [Peribacillus sp. NPDC058002]|uniref:hypothetical protein n=1 Tax=Peribacillus sp. NPDC058002 TaxID=3346301 RepID=UPI0036DCAF5E
MRPAHQVCFITHVGYIMEGFVEETGPFTIDMMGRMAVVKNELWKRGTLMGPFFSLASIDNHCLILFLSVL